MLHIGRLALQLPAVGRIASIFVALAIGLVFPGNALAQGLPPQKDYFVGEDQVDLQRGSFLYSNTDIVAGATEPATQIPVVRQYNASGSGPGPFGSLTTHSLEIMIHVSKFIEEPAGPKQPSYRFYVVRGGQMETFYQGYGSPTMFYEGGSGGFQQLTMSSWLGPYTYTGPDGTVINFPAATTMSGGCRSVGLLANWCAPASDLTYPDGTKWTFAYDTSKYLKLVTSNRGYAVGFVNSAAMPGNPVTQICAVNLATAYASVTNPCPANAISANYSYSCIVNGCKMTGFTDQAGQTTTYGFGGTGFADGISSITLPGSGSPDLVIAYNAASKKVASQTYADGSAWSYAYADANMPWDTSPTNQQTDVAAPDNTSVRYTFLGAGSKPSKVRDQNNREWNYVYGWVGLASVLTRSTDPEGNYTNYTYSGLSRQPTEIRKVAKPGSGLPDIVATATYTSPCTANPKLCEKPLTKTDASGNTTTYTYDAVHGGVLTETGPAVGGVAPQKRYEYAQRYAWVKNSAGAYVQGPTPVWVLTRERYCRTTAASGTSCAGGAADEVITDYDYGPNSGPNNLLLRGIAVTAEGETLRTCYGYDGRGRKISETKPSANLTSCP